MKTKVMMILVLFCTVLLTNPVFGSSTSHGSSHTTGHVMDHSGHNAGKKIHEAKVGEYVFEYSLIDMKEKMKDMKKMPKINETHHLMVHVKDTHGKMIEKAKVGYLIESADKSAEKKMAMAMNKGFGADVTLLHGKQYLIKTKVLAGDKKLMDSFEFTLAH